MDTSQNGQMPITDASGIQGRTAKAAHNKGKNQAAKREHYAYQIEANEERLRTGLTANGVPLTPGQAETTRQLIEQQREKLASLS